MTSHVSYCRNCGSVCGMLLEIEDNRLVSVAPDKANPNSEGYICVKGLASVDQHNGEDRITSSRRRNPDGNFEDIAAATAMDEIHARLESIIARHGPGSVALYYGTGINNNAVGHSALKGWMHLIGSPYVFSSMTLDQSAKWVTAGRMGFFATGKPSTPDADVIMIVGSNPAFSHTSFGLPMSNPMKAVRDARKAGMKFIVVDPRLTETARLADIHVRIKPGEDAAFFAGLIRIILDEGLEDKGFCERFVTSVDVLRAKVEPFTPDYVATRTGVPRETLLQVARLFAGARRKAASSGTGPNMAPHSNLSEHLLEAFNALCGGYCRAGDIIRNTGALFGRMVKEAVFPPDRTWERGPKLHSVDIGPLSGEYPTALLPREIEGRGEDRIRALIVVGGNPAKALSEPDKSLKSLRKLELLVALDTRESATVRMADYTIATSLPFERHDYTGMAEFIFTKTFAHATQPYLERPAGVIDDWEFFYGLARRSGKALPLKRPLYGLGHKDIPGETLEIAPDADFTGKDIVTWMCSHGQTSYDELVAHPHGLLLAEREHIVEPAGEDDGARLDLCPPDVAAEIDAMGGEDASSDPDFPMRLIVRRMIETMNSAFTEASRTRQRYSTNPAFLSAADMERLEIENQDLVEISSRTGTVVAAARRDPGLEQGVISMTHAWGDPENAMDDAFTGRLVSLSEGLQTINFMPVQSAVPVRIKPLACPRP